MLQVNGLMGDIWNLLSEICVFMNMRKLNNIYIYLHKHLQIMCEINSSFMCIGISINKSNLHFICNNHDNKYSC